MPLKTKLLDLLYACRTIGVEDQPEKLGDNVVEFPARLWIRKFGAVGATLYLLLHTAGAHLAPGRLYVFATSLAFTVQVGSACAAVKPAISYQLSIYLNI